MIKVENVCKNYNGIAALEDVSFRVERGEIVGLLGPNGAGKTTLIKILTGYFEPSLGKVQIGEQDVIRNPVKARRSIGYLPENAPLYHEMLVQESLVMTADLRQIPYDIRTGMLRRAIQSTGLQSVLNKPIGKLSKGFRQRVGLAQAILHKPSILILDEPTSGLDPEQIADVRDLIHKLARQCTVLLSTHILSEVEQTCERVLVLLKGRLRADARLSELTASNRYRVGLAVEPGKEAEALAGPTREALLGSGGVRAVEVESKPNGRVVFSVEGEPGVDLGAKVFELAKNHNWPLRQLQPDQPTLESVYRAITSGKEISL